MLKQRVLTAVILATLMVSAVLTLSTANFAALLGLLMLLAAWEWSNFIAFSSRSARVGFVGLVAAGLWLMWLNHATVLAQLVLVLAFASWVLGLFWIVRPEFGRQQGRNVQLLKMLVGVVVLVPTWLGLVLLHSRPAIGPQTVLFLMLLIWAADIGAYFSGRRWGHTKLAPRVSPGKTWEGVYGALFAAMLFAFLCTWWLQGTPQEVISFLLLCMVTILFSIEGDLLESLMKRQCGIKDSGTLFPGHGGVMDRIDSLTAAAPIFALGLAWTGL